MNGTDHPPVAGAQSSDGAPVLLGATLRIVFDTNVLLSMYVFVDSRFAPFRLRVDAGQWIALTSPTCLGEFERVLAYPAFALDVAAQAAIFASYAGIAESVVADPSPQIVLPRCQDRDDQKFLEAARDGGAQWLVTADKALLKLARRDKLKGLFRILTPEAALAEL